jgi:hypothetical protein
MNRGQDDKEPIEDKMRDDHLYRVLDKDTWMIDIIRAILKMPLDHLDKNYQRRIISESRKYFWDAPYLFKLGNDGVMRRCVPREERLEILRKCHSAEYGGHYSHFRTQAKVWSSGFYWPKMHEDTKRYVASCPECQRTGNIPQRNSMRLRYNLQINLFDVWGIEFMGPFKNSHGFEHILVMVDYVSKWVEARDGNREFPVGEQLPIPSPRVEIFPAPVVVNSVGEKFCPTPVPAWGIISAGSPSPPEKSSYHDSSSSRSVMQHKHQLNKRIFLMFSCQLPRNSNNLHPTKHTGEKGRRDHELK